MNSGNRFVDRGKRGLVCVIGVAFLAGLATAQEPATGNVPTATQPAQPAEPYPSAAVPVPEAKDSTDSSVRLGAGDLLEVNVFNVPDLTTNDRVSNSGDVYLPLIDYVHVDGLTQEEAQALIEKRLSDGGFVRSPHVTIFVDEAASQGVTLLGEVMKPGIYPDT